MSNSATEELKAAVQQWWQGEFRTTTPTGWYRRHWTSQVAHALAELVVEHWKPIVGFVAVTAVGVTLHQMGFL